VFSLLVRTFVGKEFQEVRIQRNSVVIDVGTLEFFLAFFEENCEPWESIEAFWAKVRQLGASYERVVQVDIVSLCKTFLSRHRCLIWLFSVRNSLTVSDVNTKLGEPA